MEHIRKTSLRSMAMHTRYITRVKQPNFFDTAPSVLDFSYWRVIENDYAYDTIAKVHDMLIPRREVSREVDLNEEERAELEDIKNYISEKKLYDLLQYNFPHQQSQPGRLHYHLITLK